MAFLTYSRRSTYICFEILKPFETKTIRLCFKAFEFAHFEIKAKKIIRLKIMHAMLVMHIIKP